MPAIECFDEDAHAARNGYGDDEDDLDLFGMPESYTYDELMDMAATMELTDEQEFEFYSAIVDNFACCLTMSAKPNKAETQLKEYLAKMPEYVLGKATAQNAAQAA